MKITFCIPAFGESPHIRECISSLKNQTISVDIVVSTSTPSVFLEKVTREYGVPLKINTTPLGISADWNFAYSQNGADLFVLAHQDDVYLPNFAKLATEFFNKNRNVGILFFDTYELIDGKLVKYNRRELVKRLLRRIAFLNKQTIGGKIQYSLLLGLGCPIPCPSVVFNRSVLKNFRFSEEFEVNLDWDAWHRISSQGHQIGYLPISELIHRIHQDAETQAAILDNRRHNEDRVMFERMWPRLIAKLLLFMYGAGYKA